MTTRGVRALREAGIDHEILTYRYARRGAQLAANAVGLPPAIVLKSLVFRADDGSYLFALIGGDASVSTRSLGRVRQRKHVEPAATRDAERITGYQVGGISPFGARRVLPVVLDAQTASHPSLVINAGARGILVRLATVDLVRTLDASIADIRAR